MMFYLKRIIKTWRTEGLMVVFGKIFRKISRNFQSDLDLNALAYGDFYDFTKEDLAKNELIMKGYDKERPFEIKTATWFLPSFSSVTGGIVTIYKFAKLFQDHGVKNRFVIFGAFFELPKDVIKRFQLAFPDLQNSEFSIFGNLSQKDIEQLPYSDVAVATRWDSAYAVLKFNKTKGKFYIMQDFEPLFYPAGKQYALAEQTYRFGFVGLVSSLGLYNEYKKYNDRCDYFVPPVDRSIYFPGKKSESGPISVVFYGRPSSLRNGFELGIGALRKVKARYGDKVNILSVGEDWEEKKYGVRGIIKNMGFVPMRTLAKIYGESHIGLAFVFTKHPSFQPLELMASGSAAVTNFNESNFWIYKDRENCLLPLPSESCVADAICELIENRTLREKLVKNGMDTISKRNWEDEMSSMWKFVVNGEHIKHD